jgi:hypothetical protein
LLKDDGDRASLILADEVLVYVEKAMAVKTGDSNLGRQTMTFLQQLTESVAGSRKAALVYSLQASVAEAVGDEGLLMALDKLVGRVDARRVPVQDRQVKEIIRRRLFKDLGDEELRRKVARAHAAQWKQWALGAADTKNRQGAIEEEATRLEQEIFESYPLHPSLIRLMYERWGSLPSYQRTRGALQFLGTVVHVLARQQHGETLIGPGDIPLGDADVRSEFFRQVGERATWDSILDADVVGANARARKIDRRIGEASPVLEQARIGTRLATAITLYSFGSRKDDLRGVSTADLHQAMMRPGVDAPTLEAALDQMSDHLLHLHRSGQRYRLDTVPSLTKLIEQELGKVKTEDAERKIRERVNEWFGSNTSIVWPDSAAKIPDGQRQTKLVYLGLSWGEFDEESARQEATKLLLQATSAKRKFLNALGFVLPSKIYGDEAREQARRLLALEVLDRKDKKKLGVSEEQIEELREKLKNARSELEGACRSLYTKVLLPVRSKDGSTPVAFRSVDLGTMAAGKQPHEQILELLKNQIFTEIKAQRLATLLKLEEETTPSFVPMREALDSFFRHLDYPKVREENVLLKAIAQCVQEKKLGYIAQAKEKDDQLQVGSKEAIHFGSRHAPDEFSDEEGAYLLSAGLATSLQAAHKPSAPPPPPPPPPTNPEQPFLGTTPTEPTHTATTPPVPPVEEALPGQPGQVLVLTATAVTGTSRKQWLKLGEAILKLVQQSTSSTIKVSLEVHKAQGFSVVELRNEILELLEENDIQFSHKLGNLPGSELTFLPLQGHSPGGPGHGVASRGHYPGQKGHGATHGGAFPEHPLGSPPSEGGSSPLEEGSPPPEERSWGYGWGSPLPEEGSPGARMGFPALGRGFPGSGGRPSVAFSTKKTCPSPRSTTSSRSERALHAQPRQPGADPRDHAGRGGLRRLAEPQVRRRSEGDHADAEPHVGHQVAARDGVHPGRIAEGLALLELLLLGFPGDPQVGEGAEPHGAQPPQHQRHRPGARLGGRRGLLLAPQRRDHPLLLALLDPQGSPERLVALGLDLDPVLPRINLDGVPREDRLAVEEHPGLRGCEPLRLELHGDAGDLLADLVEPGHAVILDQRGAGGVGAHLQVLPGEPQLAGLPDLLRLHVGVEALLLRDRFGERRSAGEQRGEGEHRAEADHWGPLYHRGAGRA